MEHSDITVINKSSMQELDEIEQSSTSICDDKPREPAVVVVNSQLPTPVIPPVSNDVDEFKREENSHPQDWLNGRIDTELIDSKEVLESLQTIVPETNHLPAKSTLLTPDYGLDSLVSNAEKELFGLLGCSDVNASNILPKSMEVSLWNTETESVVTKSVDISKVRRTGNENNSSATSFNIENEGSVIDEQNDGNDKEEDLLALLGSKGELFDATLSPLELITPMVTVSSENLHNVPTWPVIVDADRVIYSNHDRVFIGSKDNVPPGNTNLHFIAATPVVDNDFSQVLEELPLKQVMDDQKLVLQSDKILDPESEIIALLGDAATSIDFLVSTTATTSTNETNETHFTEKTTNSHNPLQQNDISHYINHSELDKVTSSSDISGDVLDTEATKSRAVKDDLQVNTITETEAPEYMTGTQRRQSSLLKDAENELLALLGQTNGPSYVDYATSDSSVLQNIPLVETVPESDTINLRVIDSSPLPEEIEVNMRTFESVNDNRADNFETSLSEDIHNVKVKTSDMKSIENTPNAVITHGEVQNTMAQDDIMFPSTFDGTDSERNVLYKSLLLGTVFEGFQEKPTSVEGRDDNDLLPLSNNDLDTNRNTRNEINRNSEEYGIALSDNLLQPRSDSNIESTRPTGTPVTADVNPPLGSVHPPFSSNEVLLQQNGIVFSRASKVKIELPSTVDNSSKPGDTVSVSSLASTISYGSTFRGISVSSGLISPGNGDESAARRLGMDPKPPLFPKRWKENTAESPKTFVESVTKKLVNHGSLHEEDDEDARVDSRWIRQKPQKSFDPKSSIFAAGRKKRSDSSSLSPPGSPPEPMYPEMDDDDLQFLKDSNIESIKASKMFYAEQEALTWDMISDFEFMHLNHKEWQIDPALLKSADNADWCEESVRSVVTDVGTSSKPTLTSTTASDIAHLSGQRGMVRTVSSVSLGSSRRSRTPDSGRRPMRNQASSSQLVSDAEIPFHSCMAAENDSETGSLGVQSSSPNMTNKTDNLLSQLSRTKSLPDLTGTHITQPLSVNDQPFVSTNGVGDHHPSRQLNLSTRKPNRRNSAVLLYHRIDRNENGVEIPVPVHGVTMLEEELMAFSSMRRLEIPFRYASKFPFLKYIGSIRWRQLVAYWKHTEIVRAITARHASPDAISPLDAEDCSDSIASGSRFSTTVGRGSRRYRGNLELQGKHLGSHRENHSTKTSGGFNPQHRDVTLSSISRFLCLMCNDRSSGSSKLLKHNVTIQEKSAVEHLLECAEALQSVFTTIIKDIVGFASMNLASDDHSIRFLVGLKCIEDIHAKANRKYSGNILQVKDVLRARIIFPDEGSLVCGLLRLATVSDTGVCLESKTSEVDSKHNPRHFIQIVRVKNLLSSDSILGLLSQRPLPTGYRHILVNVAHDNGLLAEIQFNLSSLYDVLGEEGIALHREIASLQFCGGEPDKTCPFDLEQLVNGVVEETKSVTSEESILETLCCVPLYTSNEKNENPSMQNSFSAPNANCYVPDLNVKPKIANETALEKNENIQSEQLIEGDGRVSLESSNEAIIATTTLPDNGASTSSLECRINVTIEDDMLTADVSRHLDDLRTHLHEFSIGDVILAMLGFGSLETSSSSRDVSKFYCMYALFSFIIKQETESNLRNLGFGIKGRSDLVEYAQKCLLRCLNVSNQATSTGMTGWLEYGSSSALDRLTQRPFHILRLIAYDFVSRGQFEDAECVISALVLQCEQSLPLYHPTTLASLLDLAIVCTSSGKGIFADSIVVRVAERISFYLSAMENEYLSHLSGCRTEQKQESPMCRIEDGRDALFMLNGFTALFQSQLRREIVTLVGCNHPVILVQHCFVADSLAVLANCVTAARSFLGSASENGNMIWRLAYAHYQKAFKGSYEAFGLGHPSTARAAYGTARCLREFGDSDKALEILSLVVAASEENLIPFTSISTPLTARKPLSGLGFLPKQVALNCRSSLSCSMMGNTSREDAFLSSALCLWLMAVLSLDTSLNEYGRERSFSYLYAASVYLQSALESIPEGPGNESTKGVIVGFLSMIEEEAMQISEPLDE